MLTSHVNYLSVHTHFAELEETKGTAPENRGPYVSVDGDFKPSQKNAGLK